MTSEPTERTGGATSARERKSGGALSPNGRGGAPARGGLAALRVLRHREFAIFWAGLLVSMVGTWMQGFAQGWVVAGLTSSALALGLVNFAQSLPMFLLMPFGGVAADRMERRRILVITQWAMLLLALALGGLIAAGRLQLWHVYVIAFLLGIATAYDMPAYQAFYPQLVPREELPHAISLNQAAFHGARIVGPALAGWMIAVWGTAAAFFANAASFLAVLASLAFIRPRPPALDQPHAPIFGLMREGFRYVRERPGIQALLGLTALVTLFVFPNLAVLTPFYVRHVLHAGPGVLGTMMSVSGAGALVGSALLLGAPEASRVRRLVLCAGTVLGTMTALAWTRWVWLAVASVGIQSLAIAHSIGLISIMIQEAVTDEIRGRVMSLYSLTFTGVMPIGALIASSLADAIGMRWELQIGGALFGFGALWLLPKLRAVPAPPRHHPLAAD